MKLLKPSWVNHETHPIFSIDIHPDGTRFATGGQGQDSAGRVVIWNMKPVLLFEEDKNGTAIMGDAPKILCQLDVDHNACVNCVRWSNSGVYLASGGDDKAIMIWKLMSKSRPNSMLIGNGFGKPSYETWRPISDLRNHTGDILHLAWSPDDKYLASASVDNKVVIWDAQQFPLVVHELVGHSSMVKGVTWDPIGKYVATQSSDRTLKIWRTSDWQVEHCISTPFQECGGTTHVLRLDWSPDGLHLVSAHAMNAGGPTAQIIEREGWKTDKDFVGHRKAVVCVRFNQNILQQDNRYCLVALGSRDRSISIWSTALKRPVVVIRDIFTHSVMDVSWSSCGTILMACSFDGTAVVAKFDPSEIGIALTSEEKVALQNRFFGTRLTTISNNIVQHADVLLARKKETNLKPTALNLSQSLKKSPERNESEPQELTIRGPTDKQIETRRSDGKRRITPKFLLPTDDNEVEMRDDSNSNQFGKIDSEKKDQINLRDKMISNISEVKIPSDPVPLNCKQAEAVEETEDDEQKMKEISKGSNDITPSSSSLNNTLDTNTKEAKQIIESSKVSGVCNSEESQEPVKNLPATTSVVQDNEKQEEPGDSEQTVAVGSKRKRKLSDDMKPPAKVPKKPKQLAPSISLPPPLTPVVAGPSGSASPSLDKSCPSNIESLNTASPTLPTTTNVPSPPSNINGHTSPKLKLQPRNRLNPMKAEPHLSRRVQTKSNIQYILEAENATSIKGAFILRCQHDQTSMNGLEWSICTSHPICGISGDSVRTIALCEDSSAHIFDLKGRYVLPPLILSGFPSKMHHQGPYLVVITVKAILQMWNICTKKNIIKSESIAPLLDQPDPNYDSVNKPMLDVVQTSITQLGSPIVMLSNAKMFHFNQEMQAWMRYTDPELIFNPLNNVFNPTSKNFTYSELRNLRQCTPYVISEIKLKLASATEIQHKDAVHTLLIKLATTLAVYGEKKELQQLCEDLLGPTHSSAKFSTSWKPLIAGLKKRDILREILATLVNDLQWQDFYSEFDDLLQNAES